MTPRNRSLTIGLRLILRQLRSETVIVASIFLAILLSGIVLVATPRLFEETSNEALKKAVQDASPPARNLTLVNFARIGPRFDENPLIAIERAGDLFLADEVPESVQSIIRDHSFLFDSPQFRVSAFPGDEEAPFDTFMRIRYQEHIDDHIQFVKGTAPVPRDPIVLEVGEECPAPDLDPPPEADPPAGDEEPVDCEEVEVPLYELAVTAETLAELRVEVGDRLILTPDETDFLYRTTSVGELGYRLAIEISGLIEPIDPDEEFWFADDRLDQPRIVENPDFVIIFATGLTTPADYRSLVRDTGLASWWFQWRYFVDGARIETPSVDLLLGDIRTLEANFTPALGLGFGHQMISTDLSGIIEGYQERRTLTSSMLALALAGLFLVAVGVVAVLSVLVAGRQRRSMILLRNRGASRGQLISSRLAQGLVLSLPAAVLACLISIGLAPGGNNTLSWQIASLVAVVATAIVLLSGRSVYGKDLGSIQSGNEVIKTASVRRLVVEALIVAVAIGAVILLRRRVLIDASVGDEGGFDPLLALAPVVLGVAAGIVTNRLYLLPVRFLAWLGSVRPGMVMFVGFRRIRGQPAIARLPMIVILVAVAVAVFASVIRFSIEEGQLESTWHRVGADYRVTAGVDGSALATRVDLSGVEAIDALAFGLRAQSVAPTQARAPVPPTIDLLALDMDAYSEVAAGTPADPSIPDFLLELRPGDDIGQVSNPIPVIASRFWLPGRPPSLGDQFALSLGAAAPVFQVAGVVEQWPGIPVGQKFIIANLEAIEMASAPLTVKPTDIFIRAGRNDGAIIEQTLAGQSQSTRLTSRDELFDALHDEPFAAGLDRGLRWTFLVATVFAITTAVASIALTARTRRRDFGYLRTMGSTGRQAVAMTMIEQLPPALAAVIIGTGLGAGTALLFEPGIDVSSFTGPGLPADLSIDITVIALVAAGLLSAVVLAVGIFGIVTRREALGTLLRAGEEP